jgi:hypothetical protein
MSLAEGLRAIPQSFWLKRPEQHYFRSEIEFGLPIGRQLCDYIEEDYSFEGREVVLCFCAEFLLGQMSWR